MEDGSGVDPEGKTRPSRIHFYSPKQFHNSGVGKLLISFNGVDYIELQSFTVSEAAEIYRLSPLCGPKDGKSKLKLFGSGFVDPHEEMFSKFGTIAVQKIDKDQVTQEAWNQASYLTGFLMTQSDSSTYAYKEHPLSDG
jgi:hypothetical protein